MMAQRKDCKTGGLVWCPFDRIGSDRTDVMPAKMVERKLAEEAKEAEKLFRLRSVREVSNVVLCPS